MDDAFDGIIKVFVGGRSICGYIESGDVGGLMFETNNPFSVKETIQEPAEFRELDTPWTFSVTCEDGVWSIHFSRCDVQLLHKEWTKTNPNLSMHECLLEDMEHLPGTPRQWVTSHQPVTDDIDLLMAPGEALERTQARFGFVQMDSLHAVVYTKELTDLFSLWTAWLLQRFPAKSICIDPHRCRWDMQISLLWPHPIGQWSEIRRLPETMITAFDIVDYGWSPEGEVTQRVRTRLVKTNDKSWRTGWMW